MVAARSPQSSDRIFRFGPFELTPHLGELRRNCRRVDLQNQPMLILLTLLEHSGELVTREVLQRRLWPADTFVDFDMGLNTAVRKLRQALGDSAERPRYIETYARRGYRFIAPVASADAFPRDGSPNEPPPTNLPSAFIERPTATVPDPGPVLGNEGQIVAALDRAGPLLHSISDLPIAAPPASTAPASSLSATRRSRRLPFSTVRAAGALLVLALLLVGMLLASLLTVWNR